MREPYYATGTIILQNENKSDVIIPVDITGYTIAVFQTTLIKTSIISNGEVTYDDTPTLHFTQAAGSWHALGGTRKRTANAYQGNSQSATISNGGYAAGSASLNLTAYYANSSTVNSNGIKIITNNASRYFCKTGYYAEYEYKVWWI